MKKALLLGVLLFSLPTFAMIVKDGKVTLEKLSDYEFCQSKDYTGQWCHRALEDWVEGHRDDAWEAAKMTRRSMNHWVAIPFFVTAQKGNSFNCADEDLSLAVVSALNLPATGNEKIIASAKELGLTKCKKEVLPAIQKEASADSYLFANACTELELQGLKKKKCEEISKGKK